MFDIAKGYCFLGVKDDQVICKGYPQLMNVYWQVCMVIKASTLGLGPHSLTRRRCRLAAMTQ